MICEHDGEVPRDVLEYCRHDPKGNERKMPRYVMLRTGQTRLIIRTSRRAFGECDGVFVHPETKNAPPHGKSVEPVEATEWQFFRYRSWYDRRRRAAFLGFLLAVSGALVDGALLVGDKGMGIATAAWWIDTMRVLALFAKLIGLGFVFFEGLLKE